MYEPIPEPPASSWPDHFSVKLEGLLGGSVATLLVGAPASMVLTNVGVLSGAFVSKTTDACALTVVPVTAPALGWTL